MLTPGAICATHVRNRKRTFNVYSVTDAPRPHLSSIDVTRDGDIATVALNNPGKLNALTIAMWRELARVMRDLSADDDAALHRAARRRAMRRSRQAPTSTEFVSDARNDFAQAKSYHHEYVSRRAEGGRRMPASDGGDDPGTVRRRRTGDRVQVRFAHLRRVGALRRADQPARLRDRVRRTRRFARARGPRASRRKYCSKAACGMRRKRSPKVCSRAWCPTTKCEEEAYATARRIADGAPLVARWHKQFIRRLTSARRATDRRGDRREFRLLRRPRTIASDTMHSSTRKNRIQGR